ncbi:hypothetical protein [Helicobacter acinonychis]|nr:hypothetical protein [Helicobacter acinonychis]
MKSHYSQQCCTMCGVWGNSENTRYRGRSQRRSQG